MRLHLTPACMNDERQIELGQPLSLAHDLYTLWSSNNIYYYVITMHSLHKDLVTMHSKSKS